MKRTDPQVARVSGTVQIARYPAESYNRIIERIVITGPNPSNCVVYIGSISAPGVRDSTSQGNQAVAEYATGLDWPNGLDLIIVWDAITEQASSSVQWRSNP